MPNFKQQLFAKTRVALVRAFEAPEPKFNVCFLRVSAWFQQSIMLSKKNVELGNKYIIKLREMGKDNVESQILIDRLDELRIKALERIKRRADKKEKLATAEPKRPIGRPRKNSEPLPLSSPATDPSEIWARALEEKKL